MIEVKNKINNINNSLKKDYMLALKNPKLKAMVINLKINDDLAMKYTSKLEDSAGELSHCENCSSLLECQNKIEGYVYYPKLVNNR